MEGSCGKNTIMMMKKEIRNRIVLISCQVLQPYFPEDEAERQDIHFPHQPDEKPNVPAYHLEDHAERRRILGKRRNDIISTSGIVKYNTGGLSGSRSTKRQQRRR